MRRLGALELTARANFLNAFDERSGERMLQKIADGIVLNIAHAQSLPAENLVPIE